MSALSSGQIGSLENLYEMTPEEIAIFILSAEKKGLDLRIINAAKDIFSTVVFQEVFQMPRRELALHQKSPVSEIGKESSSKTAQALSSSTLDSIFSSPSTSCSFSQLSSPNNSSSAASTLHSHSQFAADQPN